MAKKPDKIEKKYPDSKYPAPHEEAVGATNDRPM